MLDQIVTTINGLLWNHYVLLIMLLACGIWFTLRLNFIQFRHFPHMFSVMAGSTKGSGSGISSFGALCTSLSARVGTGNLAGVAVAISLGGPGAIFWMWVIALLGMAIGFAESTLGQLYKIRDDHGEFRGGPAYYIQQGLNKRWLAMAFSVCIFLGYGLIFSSVQANSITDALQHAYGFEPFYSGLFICIIAGSIVVGGLKGIARFSEVIVPMMGVGYVLVTLAVVLANLTAIPHLLATIVTSAFGVNEAMGGTVGAALQHGVKRGLYSNEAGSGSVPQAAAAATPYPPHPASQGMVQMLGVFIDTIILCTCTAVVILLAGFGAGDQMEGIRMTQDAMTYHLGNAGSDVVAAAICMFAFSSVVANYAYGESNLHMFKLDNTVGRLGYTICYLLMVMWGSSAALPRVWALADMALGLMTVINVIAIIWLTPTIVAISKDYFAQQKQGKLPEYRSGVHQIQGATEQGIWPEVDHNPNA